MIALPPIGGGEIRTRGEAVEEGEWSLQTKAAKEGRLQNNNNVGIGTGNGQQVHGTSLRWLESGRECLYSCSKSIAYRSREM